MIGLGLVYIAYRVTPAQYRTLLLGVFCLPNWFVWVAKPAVAQNTVRWIYPDRARARLVSSTDV